jgi:polyvinyl alcohol dehydrogenase (cytochrome)
MRRGAAAFLAALAVALPAATPAHAATQRAYAAGLMYLTPAVVAAKGDSLLFRNLDPLAQHNIVSDTPGLFASPLIGQNQTATVAGVPSLPVGTYAFHCTLHAWMKGALRVQAEGVLTPPAVPALPNGPEDLPNPVDLLPAASPAPLGASEWPLYGRDLSNSRSGGSDSPSYNEVPTLGPVWSFRSTDGDFTGTPVIAEGTLVAVSGGGTVFALNASTGALRWQRDLGELVNGSAAIADGRVFVPLATSGAPKIAALSLADGSPLWTSTVDTQPRSYLFGSPTAWAGDVYIGISGEYGDPRAALRGAVVALDQATGAQVWKTYTVPDGFNGGPVWSTPAIDTQTGRLFVGTGNGLTPPAAPTTDAVLMLDAQTGALLDHFQATANDAFSGTDASAGPDYDFGASPNLIAGTNGRKLVGEGQKDGTYWALDRNTLDPVWSRLTGPGSPLGGIIGSTAYDGKRVYGPDTIGGELWALNATNGVPAWLSVDGGPLHNSPSAVANGVVYTTDMSSFLTARESATGAILAKLPLGAPSWGGVSLAGGYVFAVTGTQGDAGYVVAFRPRG